ncbi:MAG: carboxypeptidase regulatory-like domain-containing protein [Planctomycetaceae bacterium]|nr:carboxypeptidase regulatory-like domain-containing protein [Planctomycetaceae bacterium]
MQYLLLLLTVVLPLQEPELPVAGAIAGVVVNESRGDAPVANAEVALRVSVDGQFILAAETHTDERGQFRFDDIPADAEYLYLPGATWESIHYPGERIRLTAQHPTVSVTIPVRDTIQSPSPLRVRSHEIIIRNEDEAIRVTETMTIDNPVSATWVGKPSRPGGRARTLRLSIPGDFRRVTFQNEFFGKRFVLIDEELVTDVPWTPGQRELQFTYVLPAGGTEFTWNRPLDLPTDQLQLRVVHDGADRSAATNSVTASPPLTPTENDQDVAFTASGLNAGDVLQIQLGQRPFSLMSYARWIAVALLLVAVFITIFRQKKLRLSGSSP